MEPESECRESVSKPWQLGNFTRQPWNQDHDQRRTFLPANHCGMCMEQGSDCRQPETLTRQPGNHEAMPGNQGLSSCNHGTKYWEPGSEPRQPGSELKEPVIFTRQSWKQVQGTKIQLQPTKKPTPGNQK